jgi:3-phenylpropionate/trans-cinnamate dioxygenase ferredoxin subunit
VDVAAFEAVARLDDLPPGAYSEYEVGGTEIILANVAGVLHAFAAICSHLDGPLVQGALAEGVIECPWHFSRFRVADGSVLAGPATEPIATYPVKVEGDSVLVDVSRPIASGGEAWRR